MQSTHASLPPAMRRIRDAARSLAPTAASLPRRSLGTHSRGWYQRYAARGPEGFLRPETAAGGFDWDAPEAKARSRCFLEVSVDGQRAGRLVVELLDELLPETSENFRLLCSGDAPSGASYVESTFARRVVKGVGLLGGALDDAPGGSHSAFADRPLFADEGFFVPHAEPGLLTMASSGVDGNGSQFYVTVEPAPHLDGRCVAFGRLVEGLDVVRHLHDSLYTQRGVPVEKVVVEECGVVDG